MSLRAIFSKEDEGKRPPWTQGRHIEECSRYFAGLTLLVGIGSYILGLIWPSLGEKTLTQMMISVGVGVVIGLPWLFLRIEKLQFARIALMAHIGFFAAAAAIMLFKENDLTGDGVLQPIGFVGLLLMAALIWSRQREVAREIERRAKHAMD